MKTPCEYLRVDQRRQLAKLDSGTLFQALPGMDERLPYLALGRHGFEAPHEQAFRRAAAGQSAAQQACGKHSGVIDDEQVSQVQQRGQVRKLVIRERARRAVEDQQTRKAPLLRRLLRNQFGRKRKVKVG